MNGRTSAAQEGGAEQDRLTTETLGGLMSQGTTAQQEPTVLSDVADAERVGKAFVPVEKYEEDDGERMLEIGPLLRRVLESCLDSRPAVEAKIEDAVKKRVPLELGASVLAELLAEAVNANDVRPGLSSFRPRLMAAICKTFGDPDDPLEDWFLQGAPGCAEAAFVGEHLPSEA
eukprot:2374579-Amphidinium_carterae.2